MQMYVTNFCVLRNILGTNNQNDVVIFVYVLSQYQMTKILDIKMATVSPSTDKDWLWSGHRLLSTPTASVGCNYSSIP